MKRFITILLVILMLAMCLTGCQQPSTEQPTEQEATTQPTDAEDQYPIAKTDDFWRLVYAEQHIYIWVWTLDNTVWVANGNSSMTKWTVNGQDLIWKGSLEATFAPAN